MSPSHYNVQYYFWAGPPTKTENGIAAVIGFQIKSCPVLIHHFPGIQSSVYFRHQTARKQPTLYKFENENQSLLLLEFLQKETFFPNRLGINRPTFVASEQIVLCTNLTYQVTRQALDYISPLIDCLLIFSPLKKF